MTDETLPSASEDGRFARVREIHYSEISNEYGALECRLCREPWPCETIRAVDHEDDSTVPVLVLPYESMTLLHDVLAQALGVPKRPADQAELKDLIAEALYERERPPGAPTWAAAYAADREAFEPMAAAVLTVLPPTADRTAVLREAAEIVRALPAEHEADRPALDRAVRHLRRIALDVAEQEKRPKPKRSPRQGIFNYLTGRAVCSTPRPIEEAEGLLDAYRVAVLRGAAAVLDSDDNHGGAAELRRLANEADQGRVSEGQPAQDLAATDRPAPPADLAVECNCQLRWDELARETGVLRDRSATLYTRTAELEATARQLTADRSAMLCELASVAESLRQFESVTGPRASAQVSENVGILRVADHFRRLAAEVSQPEHSCFNCEGIDPGTCSFNPRQAQQPEATDDEPAPCKACGAPWHKQHQCDEARPEPETSCTRAAAMSEQPAHGDGQRASRRYGIRYLLDRAARGILTLGDGITLRLLVDDEIRSSNTARTRASQAEDLLRVAHETSNQSEAERAQLAREVRRLEDSCRTLSERATTADDERDRYHSELAVNEADRVKAVDRASVAEAAIERVRALADRWDSALAPARSQYSGPVRAALDYSDAEPAELVHPDTEQQASSPEQVDDIAAVRSAVARTQERCQAVRDREGPGGMINAAQILGLLSPTWPDGNYEAPAPDGREPDFVDQYTNPNIISTTTEV